MNQQFEYNSHASKVKSVMNTMHKSNSETVRVHQIQTLLDLLERVEKELIDASLVKECYEFRKSIRNTI